MIEKLSGQFTQLRQDGQTEATISFHVEWEVIDGIISGTCIDDQFSLISTSPSTISGFLEDNMISFIKRYPVGWVLEENGKPRIDPDLKPHEVHYSGIIQDGHLEGDWEISIDRVDEDGELYEYYDSGPWHLDKI